MSAFSVCVREREGFCHHMNMRKVNDHIQSLCANHPKLEFEK